MKLTSITFSTILAMTSLNAAGFEKVCDYRWNVPIGDSSFSGVSSCHKAERAVRAAESKCRAFIKSALPGTFNEYASSDYDSHTYRKEETTAGPLSWGRSCVGTAHGISCSYRACRWVDTTFPTVEDSSTEEDSGSGLTPNLGSKRACKTISSRVRCERKSYCYWKKSRKRCKEVN